MARMNNEAQWIAMMGFIVSIGLFFLALVINQSVLVGQTTAEGVLEFPKNDIQDLRQTILLEIARADQKIDGGLNGETTLQNDITDTVNLMRAGKSAIVSCSVSSVQPKGSFNQPGTQCYSYPAGSMVQQQRTVVIHYNNGVTSYDETFEVYHDLNC